MKLTVKKADPGAIIRHGDVLLIPVACVPKEAQPTKDRILALGEATGHYHEASGGTLTTLGEDRFWSGGGTIKHRKNKQWTGEHHDVTLDPGTTYKIHIQRQWEPEGWSYVAD